VNIVLELDFLNLIRKMHSTSFIAIILFLIESISGAYAGDNRIVIGSSVGGVLGLVS
jgi:hypothetical protein